MHGGSNLNLLIIFQHRYNYRPAEGFTVDYFIEKFLEADKYQHTSQHENRQVFLYTLVLDLFIYIEIFGLKLHRRLLMTGSKIQDRTVTKFYFQALFISLSVLMNEQYFLNRFYYIRIKFSDFNLLHFS